MPRKEFQIKQMVNIIIEYKLHKPTYFLELTIKQLTKIYNGAGADWMPEWSRAVVTEFLELFEPAVLIHDVRFTFSDKSEAGFKKANDEMFANMKILLNDEYPLTNPLKWVGRAKWWGRARMAYYACQTYGWSAWIDGQAQQIINKATESKTKLIKSKAVKSIVS